MTPLEVRQAKIELREAFWLGVMLATIGCVIVVLVAWGFLR